MSEIEFNRSQDCKVEGGKCPLVSLCERGGVDIPNMHVKPVRQMLAQGACKETCDLSGFKAGDLTVEETVLSLTRITDYEMNASNYELRQR